jgi:hypothetical protein
MTERELSRELSHGGRCGREVCINVSVQGPASRVQGRDQGNEGTGDKGIRG